MFIPTLYVRAEGENESERADVCTREHGANVRSVLCSRHPVI